MSPDTHRLSDAIVMRDVRFSYPGHYPVLHDINLTIPRGQVVALVGPTGCGKSTLLHLCAGIIPHYQEGDLSGSVTVLGMETRTASLGALVSKCAVVTQDPENQLFNLFVEDEVVWGMENRGIDRERMRSRLDEALAFFGIRGLRARITYDLSGGEKQRVVLASAYAPFPEVFLLDEPASQLDPIGREQALRGIRSLAEAGHTIVVVEEELEDLWPVVDRVVLLDEGAIKADILREELEDHIDDLLAAQVGIPPLIELGMRLRRSGVALPVLSPDPTTTAEALSNELRGGTRGRGRAPASRGAGIGGRGRAPASRGAGIGWTHREAATPEQGRPLRLRVSDLAFTYPPPRTTEALRGIDLSLPAGTLVAVIGQNGSGKSTLARCISGELKPTRGQVAIDGQRVHDLSVKARPRTVGYVFQNPDHQIFKDPVLEDVLFGLRNLGVPRDEALERAERVLTALGLWEQRNQHPFQLSKGDRQRLAIAAIAVLQAPVMIIDEPTTGQDLRASGAIMRLLVGMARGFDQTIVVITHAMSLVARYCDLVVALNEGEVTSFGPPSTVFRDEERLRETFVKPPSVTALGNRLGLNPPPLTLEEALEKILASAEEVAAG